MSSVAITHVLLPCLGMYAYMATMLWLGCARGWHMPAD